MLKRIIAVLALWAAFGAAHATSVLPLSLDEIIDSAAVAFEGRCLETRTGRDPQTGMIVTFTTFQVDDLLKGSAGSTYTIKQVGGEDRTEGRVFRMQGVPTFKPGEAYVVFLYGISEKGFSSPVGLAQGRFEVVQEAQTAKVTNGRDFREMTSRMAAGDLPEVLKEKAGGSVPKLELARFKQLVRDRVGAAR